MAWPVIVMQGESLNWFVRQRPLLFYPQQWYTSEPFAGRAVTGSFELNGVPLPAAVYAAAFVLAFDRDGTVLWPDYYQWTSDADLEGHRVYIGRAAQYGGLQVHRQLTEVVR